MVDNLQEAQMPTRNNTAVPETKRCPYAWISRLPDDILIEVFLVLKNSHHDHSWYHITHICQHWRYVALGVANLWTKPPTTVHKFTCLMLERSGTSPLKIKMLFETTSATRTVILSHIGHIKSLTGAQSREGLEQLQNTLLASEHGAPQLTKLEFNQAYEAPNDSFRLSASTLRRIPSLKILRLSYIHFDWNIFPIKTLTSLFLNHAKLSNPPSWTQFRQALGEMRALESLYIGLSSLSLTPPHSSARALELPLLRRIGIYECLASAMRSFVHNFSFPQLYNAYLDCVFIGGSNLDECVTDIAAIFLSITKGNFDCLDILHIEDDRFIVSSKSSYGLSRTERCAIEFRILFQRCLASTQARVLRNVLAGAPGDLFSEVTHLSLSYNFTSDQLLELSKSLPQVESIWLQDVDHARIIKCLRIPPFHPPGSPIPFAKLKSIEFSVPYRARDDTSELLEELSVCLGQRYRHGAFIDNLVVNWNLDPAEAQRLQEIISEVKSRAAQSPIGSD